MSAYSTTDVLFTAFTWGFVVLLVIVFVASFFVPWL